MVVIEVVALGKSRIRVDYAQRVLLVLGALRRPSCQAQSLASRQ